jgi:hypothetical protein
MGIAGFHIRNADLPNYQGGRRNDFFALDGDLGQLENNLFACAGRCSGRLFAVFDQPGLLFNNSGLFLFWRSVDNARIRHCNGGCQPNRHTKYPLDGHHILIFACR